MTALSNNRIFKNATLSNISKFTLGIYVVHFIFVDNLRPIKKMTSSPLWEIGYIVLVLYCSIAFVKLLSRSKLTRKLVV